MAVRRPHWERRRRIARTPDGSVPEQVQGACHWAADSTAPADDQLGMFEVEPVTVEGSGERL